MQLVVPKALREEVMRFTHDNWGHQGASRIYSTLWHKVYWPNMKTDIASHVKQCRACTVAKGEQRPKRVPLRHLTASKPREIVAIDHLTLDRAGRTEKVLVVTDVYSKFSIAIPCRNETASTTAKMLLEHFIYVYGAPERIHSDQGKAFESRITKHLCEAFKITKSRTTAYHPQGNSQAERFNKTLIQLIVSLAEEDRLRWPRFLKMLCYVYNNTAHTVTGVPPAMLFLGSASRTSVDGLLGLTASSSQPADVVEHHVSDLERIHQVVLERQKRSNARNKRAHDQARLTEQLPVGARVLLKRCHFTERHKLQNKFYETPYEIMEEKSKNSVYVIRPVDGGSTKTVNRNLLVLDKENNQLTAEDDADSADPEHDDQDGSESGDDADEMPMPPTPRFVCGGVPPVVPGNIAQEEKGQITAVPHLSSEEPESRTSQPTGGQAEIAETRKSRRKTKGKHSNPHHLPVSVLKKFRKAWVPKKI